MEKPITVVDIMPKLVITVDVEAKFSEFKSRMVNNDIHHMPVVEGKKIVGMLSITDVLKYSFDLDQKGEYQKLAELDEKIQLKDLMHESVNFVFPETPIQEAAEILTLSAFNSLPVCDSENDLVGIITSRDFVRFVREYFSA